MKFFRWIGLSVSLLFLLTMKSSAHPWIPPSIPEGVGVNIHFLDPQPGELKMLADSGVRWVRMDFSWHLTERERGHYDFSAYERLLKGLEENRIQAYFILDYGNPLYDGGLAPFTDEGRKAFARWAIAAARHFAGHDILWELWNEPNLDQFWKPKSKVEDYILLAKEVGKNWKSAVPGESLVGPASSSLPESFLRKCFEAGLLDDWSAVSVHPYQDGWDPPEKAHKSVLKIQTLIERYAPAKKIPLLSGEWGYSTAKNNQHLLTQAQYLTRQWLNNLSWGIPLSIWYDWHDDGTELKNREHHFGIVEYPYDKDQVQVYRAKPAYQAAKVLNQTLGGFIFIRRIPEENPKNYVLEFRRGAEARFAAWTSSSRQSFATLNLPAGTYRSIGMSGENLGLKISKTGGGLEICLQPSVVYLIPTR